MHPLSGPGGPGKTSLILDRLRAHMDDSVRLLVPTATMAQHLQNQLAREGLVFRRSIIQTLHAFLREWAADAPEVTRPVLYLLTEEAVRRAARSEFASVANLPGFSASLAETIEEFANAGCDSERLAAGLPEAPLADAFLAVYREVDRELARRGLATRAKRLTIATERIRAEGLGGIREVFVDGFHTLTDPESALMEAVGWTSGPPWTGQMPAPHPARQSFRAPNIERETEEIARRIVEQAEAGRPFREIGIIVRASEIYAPILRATLERFGIPARFYFDSPLDHHPATRLLRGAVDAMLSGWDHARTLAVLRLAPRFAAFGVLDRFDFDIREQIPNAGLAELRALLLDNDGALRSGADKIAHKLDSLAALEEWRGYSMRPADWAARFRTLCNLFRPALPDVRTHERALELRGQSAALDAFDEALDEAALALDAAHEIGIEPWWRTVNSVLRMKSLRVEDGRRNVVHVMSAYEARQWTLPVMFVCGMVEKQFPRFYTQNAFFPDAARRRLNAAGIRIRTAADFEQEERDLFESALSSATMVVTFSWPEFDARGERNLKSLYLEELLLPDAPLPYGRGSFRALRGIGEPKITVTTGIPATPETPPTPETTATPETSRDREGAVLRDPALLPILITRTAKLSPTSLESYLQCPFQFFARKILRLHPPPARPDERLDFLTQGNIVHEVLKEWWAQPQDIGPLFERIFARKVAEKRIPFGYHSEHMRNQMLDDLRAFAASRLWPRDRFQSLTEEPFELPLGGVIISGKIDRLDTAADGKTYVIDYKYSAAANVRAKLKNQTLLQAPLYMLAAQEFFRLKPEGMFYLGVKGKIEYSGWAASAPVKSEPLPANWLAESRERTLGIVDEIRQGRVEPAPANIDNCRFCDARDACRVDFSSGAADAEAEGA
jgi:ATP-dependent helicase/DNAse subunit B